MNTKKKQLVTTAERLYNLGNDVETARDRLKTLADRGAAYDSGEMRAALAEYQALEERWKRLEEEYLRLRGEIRDKET